MGSNLISDGSELLLLVPEVAGLVGGVVLPVLGAVPDGMMVLFSGLGPIEKAQENVSVGVGALAGSTIMLLTVPWFLSILAGRVDLEADGTAKYKPGGSGMKLTRPCSLTGAGIKYRPQIRANAKMMMFTALTYLVIQIPALMADKQGDDEIVEVVKESRKEHVYAFIGLIICFVEFCVYLYWQYLGSLKSDSKKESSSSVGSCWQSFLKKLTPLRNFHYAPDVLAEKAESMGIKLYLHHFKKSVGADTGDVNLNAKLIADAPLNDNFNAIMTTFFKKYANATSFDNKISRNEFGKLFQDLHIGFPDEVINKTFKTIDTTNDGYINLEEFIQCFKSLAAMPIENWQDARPSRPTQASVGDEEEDEEADEMPEDFKDLPADVQRRRILFKSFRMMGAGTLLVLIFSDPMVDVLGAIGQKTGVPAFYISFVLAPLASNASELIAAYNYASKKTSATITISLSTLEGAACMNNTFCLGIFFALIAAQGLAWKFTAETIVIVGVQLIMFLFVMAREHQTLLDGIFVVTLLPLSLAAVWVMENVELMD
eukprot:CAMPEP_0117568866 /NCGR_PEP_ID=MMETSP0784-20121206/58362_1 /TAXON_ID=39447 /ORGANISM="" /LENGTH=542 /DNA_ID=CAMNT_0005366819 /DNA_START=139 /DNA_END=1767 /DNA_ORIENTATION=+